MVGTNSKTVSVVILFKASLFFLTESLFILNGTRDLLWVTKVEIFNFKCSSFLPYSFELLNVKLLAVQQFSRIQREKLNVDGNLVRKMITL